MKAIYKIILISFVLIHSLSSQNLSDVVRWSNVDYSGTARSFGVGSSFGAMGGDYSVININPAGIADFRVSEFTLTPALRSTNTSSFFVADPNNITKNKSNGLGLNNIAFVIASNPNSSWSSSNFAIGFTRTLDLQRRITVRGVTPGSMTEYFAQQANGLTEDELDDFIAYPAYNTGAIYDFDGDLLYSTDFIEPDLPVSKSQIINQSGGVNELSIGWAGEYKNALGLGISMGIPFATFDEVKSYSETDNNDEIATFNSLSYTERLITSGTGFNFKLGMTYKFTPKFRIGAAFHSPTWYKFTDNYSTEIQYSYNDGANNNTYDYLSPDGSFQYRISSPWRTIVSAGTIYNIGAIAGFINADVEFVDYTNAKYNGTAYDYSIGEAEYTEQVNRDVLNNLGNATIVRLGTELAYKAIRFRVGYSWEKSPYINDDFSNNRLSFGIGYRADKFFIDLGIRQSTITEGYNPYVVLDENLDPLANIETKKMRSALTFGFKF